MIKRKELTDPKSCMSRADDDGLGFAKGCCWCGPAAVVFWLAVVYLIERIVR